MLDFIAGAVLFGGGIAFHAFLWTKIKAYLEKKLGL